MKKNFSHKKTSGFSLIEVLLAVAIMSFGLLALASLQNSIMRSSSNSKAQSVALSLAKDKMEDLRGYQSMTQYRALTDKAPPTCPDVDCISMGGVDYVRSWEVLRYAFPSPWTATSQFSLQSDTAVLGGSFAESNEFKKIIVRVTWVDPTGAPQNVAIEDAISALSPTDSASLTSIGKNVKPRGPEIDYFPPDAGPGGVGVIPIAIGNGTDTAATNPRPEVIGQGNNSTVVETRFNVLTYSALANGNVRAQQKIETAVVGCECSATNTTAVGWRPAYWDGTTYIPPVAATYSNIGLPRNGVTQSDRCNICCRDHRDPAGVAGPKFDRRRTDGHKHFGSSFAAGDEITTSGNYREACRLIRVDGFFRVATDLNNDYFNQLYTGNSSADKGPSAATANNYENLVIGYLKARFVAPPNAIYTPSSFPGNNPSTYVTNLNTLESTYNINSPATTPISAATVPKWSHSRGLFVDYLEQEAITAIKTAKDNTECNTARAPGTLSPSDPGATAAEVLDACILKSIPFTSINLTEIANWRSTIAASPYTPSTATIQVSNNAFVTTIDTTDPVRGKVLMGSSPVANAQANTLTEITASNSGVALFDPIDPDTDNVVLSDTQTYVNGATPPDPGGGNFAVTMNGSITPLVSSNAPRVEFTINGISVNCNTTAGTVIPYDCITTTGQALGLATSFVVTNYNRQDQKNVDNACTNSPNDTTPMPYRTVYDVSGVTSSNGAAILTAPVVVNNNGIGLPAAGGESTNFTVTPVALNDTVTVSFNNRQYLCPMNYPGSGQPVIPCGGPGNKDPTWSTTYVTCPAGIP